jgi:hypothetical protein
MPSPTPYSTQRRASRPATVARAALLAACLTATLGAVSARAEDSTISKDAKKAGHAIGEAAREVGHTAKKVGTEIGHGTAQAAKEVGPAAKEAGHDIGSGFSEFGHKIAHAAKQGWQAVVDFFR